MQGIRSHNICGMQCRSNSEKLTPIDTTNDKEKEGTIVRDKEDKRAGLVPTNETFRGIIHFGKEIWNNWINVNF